MPDLPYFSPILPSLVFESSFVDFLPIFLLRDIFRSTSGGMQMKNCLPGDEEEMVSAD